MLLQAAMSSEFGLRIQNISLMHSRLLVLYILAGMHCMHCQAQVCPLLVIIGHPRLKTLVGLRAAMPELL